MAAITARSLALLSDKEKHLLRATEPDALADVSEEDRLDRLHTRVRRARTKYLTNYRRQAAGQVVKKKARGKAQPNSAKTMLKAEIFEDALARVSRRLAALAKQSASDLRTERLAAARGEARTAPAKAATKAPVKKSSTKPKAPAPKTKALRTPVAKKRVAATRATGARRQAARDGR